MPGWRARGPACCLARFEAFPESPYGEAGQVRDAGHGELPRGRGGTATFIHGGTQVPRRRERARDGVGYLTPGALSFSRTSDRDRRKGLPGHWLVSNAVNFSYVEGALPGLAAARRLTG